MEQPPQSTEVVVVCAATVIVQPQGLTAVMVFTHADAEVAVADVDVIVEFDG